MLKKGRFSAEKILVAPYVAKKPYGYSWFKGRATVVIPAVVNEWLSITPNLNSNQS
jgi:hypothetical protein